MLCSVDQEFQSALVPLLKMLPKVLTQGSFLNFGITASLSLSHLLSFLLSRLAPRPLGISHQLVLRDVSSCFNLLLSFTALENSQTCGRNRNNKMVYTFNSANHTMLFTLIITNYNNNKEESNWLSGSGG